MSRKATRLIQKANPMSWDEITKAAKIKAFINKEGLAQTLIKHLFLTMIL